MGCFAWKITSNKWPLLFSFHICDSNEWERGSSLHIQCYLHLNRWRTCLMLASTQEDRRVREFIAENIFFSFSFVGFPMSFKQKRKKCNTCKVVKMSVSFPKESISFRWRVCTESLGMLIKPLLLSQSPWPLACQICVSSSGHGTSQQLRLPAKKLHIPWGCFPMTGSSVVSPDFSWMKKQIPSLNNNGDHPLLFPQHESILPYYILFKSW